MCFFILDIGPYMQKICDDLGQFQKPRRYLISSLKAKNTLIASELLVWYLKQGFLVENIKMFIRFEGSKCMNAFGEEITQLRREADAGSNAILALIAKLIGNSYYGKSKYNLHIYKIYYIFNKNIYKMQFL